VDEIVTRTHASALRVCQLTPWCVQVLVGGSTRIPKVRALLKDFFNGKEPNQQASDSALYI
jgi:hypothetical protein